MLRMGRRRYPQFSGAGWMGPAYHFTAAHNPLARERALPGCHDRAESFGTIVGLIGYDHPIAEATEGVRPRAIRKKGRKMPAILAAMEDGQPGPAAWIAFTRCDHRQIAIMRPL